MLVAPRFASRISSSTIDALSRDTPPWGPCGYVVYKRTYARQVPGTGRTEDWHETIERGCNGILEIGGVFTQEEISNLAYYWYNLKGTPAGRPIWQLGTDTVRKIGGDSLQNCFAGETEVLTKNGVFAIKDILGQEVEVLALDKHFTRKWVKTTFRAYGKQRLYKIRFGGGATVRATANHEWMKFENGCPILDRARSVFTSNLAGKNVPFTSIGLPGIEYDPEGYAHGFVFGDGTLVGDHCRVEIFPSKIDMVDLISGYGQLTEWCIAGHPTPVVTGLPKHWKQLPKNTTSEYALGFVLGLASADGNVRNNVRIHNKDREVLLEVQKLARHAGLRCQDPYLDREISPFDGTIKECWCITVSTYNLKKDHFIRDDQAADFFQTRTPQSIKVMSVTALDVEEEVYCCVVPEHGNFMLANGVQTFNCWYVNVDSPIDPFTFAFNQLMLGGGVGFGILPESVYALPAVKYNVSVSRVDDYDSDYIVPDNREGWVGLLHKVMECFFYTGKNFRYDTRCIRAKGRPINGFGGVASGPEELVKGIGQISDILRASVGRKLRPVQCMDIMNIIGSIVVAGNVRRSAEIAIGSPFDEEYIGAKDWSRRRIPAYRQMSNNTVSTEDTILLPDSFWRGYEGEGEAYGLFNRELCRKYGRLIDGSGYRPDPYIEGMNPCGEITLESHEACNLAEQFLPNISDVSEFGQVARLLLKANKAISTLPFWHPRTNEVVKRNMRIGLSVTGFLQAPHLHDPEVFDAVYELLEDTDKEVSLQMGVSRSIKLTTVKPSGTLSLLAGCTPGVHAAYAPFFIRRITFASTDPIIEAARKNGYNIEPKINIDGSRDLNTLVVDFPCSVPKGTQCANNYPAVKQLENQKFLQTHWADNSVSCTIYYKPEELTEARSWLRENYHDSVKSSSFLRHTGHGFKQAPYEEISEAQFKEMSSKVIPITHIVDNVETDMLDSLECSTGGCPVK